MLSYTDEQKQAWLNDDKTLSLSFSNGLTISDENIVDESMEITYTLSDENELRWGRCNPTQFIIKIDASAINFKDLYVTPTLICGEYSQVIGTFKVVEDTKSDDGTIHTLTCYDKLYEINNTDYSGWYNSINWTTINTIGKFRDAFFSHIGITQVKDSYTIDNIPLNKPLDDPKELKGLTILQAILELEGCFGRILPNGNFKHQYLSIMGDLLFPRDDLYPKDDLYPVGTSDTLLVGANSIYGLSYIGYQSELINQVTIREDSNDVGASTSTPSGTPNTYIIQGNFLMSGQESTTLSTVANYVLSRISVYSMYGGNVEVEGRPWVEVGDSLYAQGLVDLIRFPVLQITRKGVHGLADTYSAKTVKNYSETIVSQNSDIIELKGKTNKLTRTVDETISLITDPVNGLQTQITQNATNITLEATRASTAEGNLSGRIDVNASAISLEVSNRTDADDSIRRDVNASLDLKIDKDDDGTVISLINGSADYISFNANNMFEVTAGNFMVDRYGNVKAKNFVAYDNISFVDSYSPLQTLGYVGLVNVSGAVNGVGFKNLSDTSGIVMGPVDAWLWLKANGTTLAFTGSAFEPWVDGGVSLGYSAYGVNRRWSTINVVNEPWQSTSDGRLKEIHGTLNRVRDFYMSLEPIKYNFKKGITSKDSTKTHYGLVAQDVLKSYNKYYKDEQSIVLQQDSDEDTKAITGDDKKYVINYDELHAFHIAMIQELRKEVDELKAEIQELRKEIKANE